MKHFGNYALVLLLAVNLGLLAQSPGRGGRRMPDADGIQQMVNKMDAQLHFTEAQKEKVLQLHEKHFAYLKEERDAAMAAGDMMSMRDIFMDARNKLNENIMALLNDDQKQEFEKQLKERETRRREWRQRRDM